MPEDWDAGDEPRDQRERFRRWLRKWVEASGVSMRSLSRALGKDEKYVAELLNGERRSLPTPEELRSALPLLRPKGKETGPTLVEAMEAAYGVSRLELQAELETLAARTESDAPLTEKDYEAIRDFVAFTVARARRRAQQAGDGNP